jgi:hypothetical protein
MTQRLALPERCGLVSKVLMLQPQSLAGRPLSAHETSQQTGIARIENRVAIAVSLHTPGEQLEHSWFAPGETCGAGLLVLAPSPTQGDPEAASSVFRLSLTVRDPAKPNAYAFTLSAEPLQPAAASASKDWAPLTGRADRGVLNGPNNWTVSVPTEVNSADALPD